MLHLFIYTKYNILPLHKHYCNYSNRGVHTYLYSMYPLNVMFNIHNLPAEYHFKATVSYNFVKLDSVRLRYRKLHSLQKTQLISRYTEYQPRDTSLRIGLMETGGLLFDDSFQMINGTATLLQCTWRWKSGKNSFIPL